MERESDLIDFEERGVTEEEIRRALDALDRSVLDGERKNRGRRGRRKLLVPAGSSGGGPSSLGGGTQAWITTESGTTPSRLNHLESLGDNIDFMDAILVQLLPSAAPEPLDPPPPLPSAPPAEDDLEDDPTLFYYSFPYSRPASPLPHPSTPRLIDTPPPLPSTQDASTTTNFDSAFEYGNTLKKKRRCWGRRSRSWSGGGAVDGDGGVGGGRRRQSVSAMSGGSRKTEEIQVEAGEPSPPTTPPRSLQVPRASMRRLAPLEGDEGGTPNDFHQEVFSPTTGEDPGVVNPPPPTTSPHVEEELPPDVPPLHPSSTATAATETENPQPEESSEMAGQQSSPLGHWPHGLSFMLAGLACTLGLFNISRFAILSVHFGANFIIQFLLSSLVLGIPLFTFHVSLGQLLAAGTLDMWRISPIFQGIGIALLVSQALIGIYSIVGVSWMFIYFRDSFITKQDSYRWAEPYDGIYGPAWNFNSTIKLEETVPDYFSGVVLQRLHLETPANTPGRLKFQVAFNLAVVWMIVFICLSKGLRSYGKVVYLFSLVPIFGMLVLCSKLLGLTPTDCTLQIVFPNSDWSEFFLNSKSWTAAITEAFFTWGLLGASAMQIASHNKPKHNLHRDTTIITVLTLAILMLAAFLANICSQLLMAHGYLYIPSSFERMSSYTFLHPLRNPLPSSFVNTPIKWVPHNLFVVGDRLLKSGTNTRQQSGYQPLRLATELVPATLAIIGVETLSPFWSVLFYFVLILFGIAQQLAIMHCVITGIMAIKVKTMKKWETTITFFTCVCGFILGLPMTTELGIFVVYFLDYFVGGAWWIVLLYLIEIGAVFMVRGRPYSGETVVATLFNRAGSWLHNWAAPLLSFVWNVILPVILMVLCVNIFKGGNYRDLFRWNVVCYDYWPYWSRQLGCMIQLVPLITIPLVSLLQGCRYLSEGPPDIFDRLQLLYRPSLDPPSPPPQISPPQIEIESTTTTTTPSLTTIEDPPPKYTPPPSYTTATGARIAKLLHQSFRRSVRRIATVLGSNESGNQNQSGTANTLPPPPDYATVLVEINQSLSTYSNDNTLPNNDLEMRPSNVETPSSSNLSANQVAQILRNSFRRAMRDTLIVGSSSSQRLVESAVPINQDAVILEQTDLSKSA